jgi:hypothetical protein
MDKMNKLYPYSVFPLAGPGKTDRAKTRSVVAETKSAIIDQFIADSYESSFSCSTFKNNYRSKENFFAASFIPLDFDGSHTTDEAVTILDQLHLNYVLLYSQSHTADRHKFHVFLPLAESITDAAVYAATFNYVHAFFPESDASIGNPDRMFFSSLKGTESDQVVELNKSYLVAQTPSTQTLVKKPQSHQFGNFGAGYNYYVENINRVQGNEWNNCLNAAVKDMAKRGMEEEEITHELQLVYNSEQFNSSTLREIGRNFQKGRMQFLKIQERPEKEAKVGFSEMFNCVNDTLSEQYMVLKKGHERVKILKKNHSEEVTEVSSAVIQSDIGAIIMNEFSKVIPAATAKSLADTWFSQTESTCEQPAHVRFKSQPGVTNKKLDFDPRPGGSAPIWTEMMDRTTNAEALQAFIYSIFVPQSYRQQYLWLYGDGGNGKSTITDLLARMLGSSYVVSDTQSGHSSQFFTYTLDGKRLLVFPDTNSETFVMTGTFKQLTGEGLIRMEGKGKDAYSAEINVKIIINSNNFPTLSSKKADIRRIIFCEMAPLTKEPIPNVVELLWTERAAILGKCKEAYEKTVKNDGPIAFECAKIEDLAQSSDEVFEMVFEEFLTINEDSIIPGTTLRQTVSARCKNVGIKRYEYFLNYLTEKSKVAKYGIHRLNGKNVRGFKGIKLL